jgi:hypothetical protein
MKSIMNVQIDFDINDHNGFNIFQFQMYDPKKWIHFKCLKKYACE